MRKRTEQRKNARHGCRVLIDGREGSAFDNSQTIDISKGGAGLIVKQFIPVESEIGIEIDLTNDDDMVLAVAQVRWIQELKGKDCYRIGLQFKRFERGSKSRMSKYFNDLN